MSAPIDRNRFPLLTPEKPTSKKQIDAAWSKAHGKPRHDVEDFLERKRVEAEQADPWEIGD